MTLIDYKKKLMTVLMVSGSLPPDYSGATVQALRLAKALKMTKQVDILMVGMTSRFENPKRYLHDGVRCLPIYCRGHSLVEKVKFNLKVLYEIFGERDNIDIIHVHGVSHVSCSCILLAKIIKKPIIVKSTMTPLEDPSGLKRSVLGKIKLFFLNKATRIITIAPGMYNNFYQYYKNSSLKIELIPNAVEVVKSPPQKCDMKVELGFSASDYLVVTVGAVCDRKGSDFIVKAWKNFIKKRNDAYLLFVGPQHQNSTFTNQLESFIEKDKISNVVFLGKSNKVMDILLASDLFIFASKMDGLPTALLEAMSCGLPCVTMSLPGITETIIEDGINGVIVQDRDPIGFSRKMLSFYNCKEKSIFMGNNAKKYAEKQFSSDSVAIKYLHVYQNILNIKVPSVENDLGQ